LRLKLHDLRTASRTVGAKIAAKVKRFEAA
jgi:hypothetical protein